MKLAIPEISEDNAGKMLGNLGNLSYIWQWLAVPECLPLKQTHDLSPESTKLNFSPAKNAHLDAKAR